MKKKILFNNSHGLLKLCHSFPRQYKNLKILTSIAEQFVKFAYAVNRGAIFFTTLAIQNEILTLKPTKVILSCKCTYKHKNSIYCWFRIKNYEMWI